MQGGCVLYTYKYVYKCITHACIQLGNVDCTNVDCTTITSPMLSNTNSCVIDHGAGDHAAIVRLRTSSTIQTHKAADTSAWKAL